MKVENMTSARGQRRVQLLRDFGGREQHNAPHACILRCFDSDEPSKPEVQPELRMVRFCDRHLASVKFTAGVFALLQFVIALWFACEVYAILSQPAYTEHERDVQVAFEDVMRWKVKGYRIWPLVTSVVPAVASAMLFVLEVIAITNESLDMMISMTCFHLAVTVGISVLDIPTMTYSAMSVTYLATGMWLVMVTVGLLDHKPHLHVCRATV